MAFDKQSEYRPAKVGRTPAEFKMATRKTIDKMVRNSLTKKSKLQATVIAKLMGDLNGVR